MCRRWSSADVPLQLFCSFRLLLVRQSIFLLLCTERQQGFIFERIPSVHNLSDAVLSRFSRVVHRRTGFAELVQLSYHRAVICPDIDVFIGSAERDDRLLLVIRNAPKSFFAHFSSLSVTHTSFTYVSSSAKKIGIGSFISRYLIRTPISSLEKCPVSILR